MRNKKILIAVLTIFIVLFAMINKSYAANSFSLNMSPDPARVEKGKEVKITLKISSITVDEGLTNLSATLKYDPDILSITNDSVKGTGSFTVEFNAENNKISFTSAEPVKASEAIATITAKVKESTSASVAKVELASITGGNDDSGEVSISNISTMITLIAGTEDPSQQPTGDPDPIPTTTPSPTTTSEPTPTSTTTNDPNMPSTGSPQSYALPLLGVIAILGIAAFVNYKKIDNAE